MQKEKRTPGYVSCGLKHLAASLLLCHMNEADISVLSQPVRCQFKVYSWKNLQSKNHLHSFFFIILSGLFLNRNTGLLLLRLFNKYVLVLLHEECKKFKNALCNQNPKFNRPQWAPSFAQHCFPDKFYQYHKKTVPVKLQSIVLQSLSVK